MFFDKFKDDIQHDLSSALSKKADQRVEALQDIIDELRLQLSNLTHPENTN
ncbi:hypothetical protein [Bartonella schoenbuchensis]|uniref:hypothetical protein n=1 Tax=Bartonella schoenbuchensis TaxID=165694 RepID=UPI0003A00EB3|nr:hypothetical protein [Bartonella schoenbuchensis]